MELNLKFLFYTAIFIALFFAFYFSFSELLRPSAKLTTEPGQPLSISSASFQETKAGNPVKIIIPSIGVNARLQYVGLTAQGAVGAPKGAYDAAWFTGGPRPGEKGSSVITGHYGKWKSGVGSVFDRLADLDKGDKVYIQDEAGRSLSFTVQSRQVYDPADRVPDLFNKNDKAYLNLVTCEGEWVPGEKTYSKRLAIFTVAD